MGDLTAGDGVTIEWFGCATFRITTPGQTLFFDSYLDKVPGVPPAGLTTAEVERADFVFVSHAHFDHVHGADVIADRTGAVVVGNYETAHLMRSCGVPEEQIIVTAGGDTIDCGDGVTVRSLPSQHSCLYASASADSSEACLGDLGMSVQERRGREAGIFGLTVNLSDDVNGWFAEAGGSVSTYDGGQLAYVLQTPTVSVLISASSGYWAGIFEQLRPDVAILAAAGRPNIDGEPHQGSLADFLVDQVELLGRPRTILCHHDPLLPPLLNGVDVTEAERRLRQTLGADRYLELAYGTPVTLARSR
jgi:L-ascorbate metabolism protein UlaG (beta-lactamase superfamily)